MRTNLDLNKPFDGDLATYNGETWVYVAHWKAWVLLKDAQRIVWRVDAPQC